MSKSADKILKTAEALFNAHSFVSVGVDLIRDESGCSKTTLYTYFKNKQQLVQSVLQQRDQRFRSALVDAIQDKKGQDALEAIYDWHIQWFQADHFKGCLFVRAVSEAGPDEQDIYAIARAHKQWLYQLIAQKANSMAQSHAVTELFYTQLEGLISRVLVEDLSNDQIQQQKKMIFQWMNLLQTMV